ncbi:Adenylyltransferase and sulfurtransferase MOCS3 [Orobanche hederae]
MSASEILQELESLKNEKTKIEHKISLLEAQSKDINLQKQASASSNGSSSYPTNGLEPHMIHRYSRHLVLPSFGVQAKDSKVIDMGVLEGGVWRWVFLWRQANLLKSSILVVGAGGLGAPALLYFAASGVGKLGIVDHDKVELNNMHRQIIHTEAYIGQPKVKSAAASCRSVNSSIEVVEHEEALRTSNALEIFSKYDIIVDATDNAPTRYMISDCCVVLGKAKFNICGLKVPGPQMWAQSGLGFPRGNQPLVSGAALGLEGQLSIYNHNGGPCYRCLFPTPPPRTACQSCADGGVLGVVPGIIGCLQALEAIKIAASVGEPLSGRMLLFDALSARIRIVKIRGRSMQCEACGENATFNQQYFREFDYEKFTQTPLCVPPLKLNLLPNESRISSKEYNEIILNKETHVLVDVRPAHHFKIVSLPNSLNIPFSTLESRLPEISSILKKDEEEKGAVSESSARLYVVCRRGNDSQRAVQYLHKMGFNSAKDIVGGLESWAQNVDRNFPTY